MTKTAHGAALREGVRGGTPRGRGLLTVLVPCLVLLLAAAAAAQDWPSWRGRAQTGVSDQTGLVSSWSVDGENLIWFQGVHRPLDAGGVRRARMRQRPHRRRRREEGDRHLLERRERLEAVGAHLQRAQHHGPVQPGRLGQRDRGPRNRAPLRAERRRPPALFRSRRRHRLELAPVGGSRPRVRLRGADLDADHRRGPAASERDRLGLGQPRRSPAAPLRGVRQADRPRALDVDAGRPAGRSEYAVRPDRRRRQRAAADHRRQRRREHLRAAGAHRRQGLGVPPEPARHQRVAGHRRRHRLHRAQRGEPRPGHDGPRGGDRRDRQRRHHVDRRAVAHR